MERALPGGIKDPFLCTTPVCKYSVMFRGFLQAKGTLYYQHTVLLYRRQRSPSLTYQLYHAVFSKENITILLSL